MEIGDRYGYIVFVHVESKKVLAIFYEQPYSGGTIAQSPDADTECDYEFLKEKEPDVYNELLKIKSGYPTYTYIVFNKLGKFGPFEKWALDKNKEYQRLFLTPDAH
ncbi:MAG: hypothetical protein Q8T08_23230, partial [Ignavibacteria bacterium]|nr:hypothetical protein [Ignavibacteria bacterium]